MHQLFHNCVTVDLDKYFWGMNMLEVWWGQTHARIRVGTGMAQNYDLPFHLFTGGTKNPIHLYCMQFEQFCTSFQIGGDK